jgi:NAD(P)-dependent dehydrogenase (short-subunit alcohol dehydrogenase family)
VTGERPVAFITGAASGIGKAAAEVFSSHGMAVVVADRAEDAGRRVAEELAGRGRETIFQQVDVTQPESVEQAVSAVAGRLGRLDVLYNNAGGSTPEDGDITEVSDDEFWRAISVNLYGTWLCCKHAIPVMISGGGGSIVNTASIAAVMGIRKVSAYTAAKGGVVALTRSLAVQYGSQGIRVNVVVPGATLTDRVRDRVETNMAPEIRARYAVGLLEPEQIANTAYFLASDLSSGITGQVLAADSGLTIS